MAIVSGINAGLRFGLELCALVALGYWGFRASDSAIVEWLLGLGAPFAFAMVWGAFVAPKARYRLPDPQRLALECLVFTLAVLALVLAGSGLLAVLFGGAIVMNLGLMVALGQRASGSV